MASKSHETIPLKSGLDLGFLIIQYRKLHPSVSIEGSAADTAQEFYTILTICYLSCVDAFKFFGRGKSPREHQQTKIHILIFLVMPDTCIAYQCPCILHCLKILKGMTLYLIIEQNGVISYTKTRQIFIQD
jgi:hypothetical protein